MMRVSRRMSILFYQTPALGSSAASMRESNGLDPLATCLCLKTSVARAEPSSGLRSPGASPATMNFGSANYGYVSSSAATRIDQGFTVPRRNIGRPEDARDEAHDAPAIMTINPVQPAQPSEPSPKRI